MKLLDFSRPQVMGILNATPDSFSDGGLYASFDSAIRRVEEMVSEGVDIVDVGGESTRPGAAEVSEQDELDRVVPLIESICARFDVSVSVDTSKASVMSAAVDAGAALINDVRALQEAGALKAAAESGAHVCLMHMQGRPRTMQSCPQYDDVVKDVCVFLEERIGAAVQAGMCREKLLVDPGFGFGKTLEHNLSLLRSLARFKEFELPVLVGVSRKAMIGDITGRPVDERVYGSLAAAMYAFENGASIVRVHDVAATVDVLKVYQAIVSEA